MTARTGWTIGGLAVMAAAAVAAYPVPLRRWYRAWRAAERRPRG